MKKNSASSFPSAIIAPNCASPPNGPLSRRSIVSPAPSCNRLPVVPVAKIRKPCRLAALSVAHSTMLSLSPSWATSAIFAVICSCSLLDQVTDSRCNALKTNENGQGLLRRPEYRLRVELGPCEPEGLVAAEIRSICIKGPHTARI